MTEEQEEYIVEKTIKRKRNKQIVIRATEKEFEQIKKNVERSKLTQNKYLIQSALEKEITVIDGLRELIIETKRIGVNLNQLTKLANQGRVDCKGELKEINRELVEVWQSLRQLTQKQV